MIGPRVEPWSLAAVADPTHDTVDAALSAWLDAGTRRRRPRTATIDRIMALVALGRVRARRGDDEACDALNEALDLAIATDTMQRLAPVRAARAEAARRGFVPRSREDVAPD